MNLVWISLRWLVDSAHGCPCWLPPPLPSTHNGDIHICMDVHTTNTAVKQGQSSIPTIEESLQDINGVVMFSKLDLKWSRRQCDIMTFNNSRGLFFSKRLLLGITSALKEYQHAIQRVLERCKDKKKTFLMTVCG